MISSVQSFTPESSTVGSFLNETARRFETADIESPRLDARILLSHILGIEPSQLFTRSNDPIDLALMDNINALVERRLAKEPVSRIIGKREFWGLTFELSSDTLDPRPDTETVVAAVLELEAAFGNRPVRILDLGTGTGCILLALLSEWPRASGLGVDISAGAVSTAITNAHRLGLSDRTKFAVGDWVEGIKEEFDVVVSNPPYVAGQVRQELPAEVVQYDPPMALFGGPDGLDAYRHLLPSARRVMKPRAYLAMEVGLGQSDTVSEMMQQAGFDVSFRRHDLSGIERCVLGCVA